MIDIERLTILTDELKELGLTLQDVQLQGVQKSERMEKFVTRGHKFPFEGMTQDEFVDLWFVLGWSDSKIASRFKLKRGQVTEKRKVSGVTEDTGLILLLERVIKEKREVK